MSLVDRTNERILLSQHNPQSYPAGEWGPGGTEESAELYVDADQDSSFDPPAWVRMSRLQPSPVERSLRKRRSPSTESARSRIFLVSAPTWRSTAA